VDHYLSLVNDLADLGVTKPVVPGIMPCTNIAQVERMAEMSGAAFPSWLRERLESGKSPEDVRRIGVEAATELCAQLLSSGAPGLHFYTLNKSTATREIYAQLGLPVT
jgi:methylenetetrahydrofolate reductase (NADPH)